jgi:hypothetical protein
MKEKQGLSLFWIRPSHGLVWVQGNSPLFFPFSSPSFLFFSSIFSLSRSQAQQGATPSLSRFPPLQLSLSSFFLQLSFSLSCAFCSGQGGELLLLPFFSLSSSLSFLTIFLSLSPSLSLSLVSRTAGSNTLPAPYIMGGKVPSSHAWSAPKLSLSHA